MGVDKTTQLLYWSKRVFTEFPEFSQLEQLSEKGFTVSHLKLLLSADSRVRSEVEPKLLQDGRIVSCRQLADLLTSESRTKTLEVAGSKVESSSPVPQVSTVVHALPDESLGDTSAPSAPDSLPLPSPEPASPEDNPRPPGGRAAPERTMTSPLKVLSSTDKACVRAVSLVTDAIVVVRETAQIGFDSDSAFKRYNEQLAELKVSGRQLREHLNALLKDLDSELDAVVVPAVADK